MENATGGIDPNLLLAKMGDGSKDDKTLWLFLLLLLYGKRGFGGEVGEGIRSVATQADIASQTQWISSQFTSTMRDLGDIRNSTDISALNTANLIKDLQSTVQSGNMMLAKDICDCCCRLGVQISDVKNSVDFQAAETRNAVCNTGSQIMNAVNLQSCETRNAIDKCCCETQNAIAMQTNTLLRDNCDNTQKILDAINTQSTRELEQKLHECQDALSNANQTSSILQAINQQCCRPHPHHWPQGNGGNGGPPGPPFNG